MYNNLNNKEKEQVKLGLQCITTELEKYEAAIAMSHSIGIMSGGRCQQVSASAPALRS